MNECFPESYRLRQSEQFQNVFDARCSVADKTLIVFVLPNSLPHGRLGIVVSKKVGNAVVRNRWKRLIREAFRTSAFKETCGLDAVVLPQRKADVCRQNLHSVKQSLCRLVEKITLKMELQKINPLSDTARKPTVLLTRPERQNRRMQNDLESLGYHVFLQPALDILPPDSWNQIDDSFVRILNDQFDWLIFSSSNGIESYFDRLALLLKGDEFLPKGEMQIVRQACEDRFRALNKKMKTLPIAVVGSSTDQKLYQAAGRYADVVPETFTAEAVAEALLPEAKQGKRFLHLRADRGRDILKAILTESGGFVTELAVYRSMNRTEADSKVMERLQQGEIDYVTVMSSAAAVSLVDLFGDLLRKTSLISISPLTTKTLCDLGYPPKAEASQYTLTGMVQALVSCVQSRNVSEPQP